MNAMAKREGPMSAVQSAYKDGSLLTSGFGDFMDLVEGIENPDELGAVLDWRLENEAIRIGEAAVGESARRRAAYRDATRRSVERFTGVTADDYDAAVVARGAGDPSPLTQIYSKYLNSI